MYRHLVLLSPLALTLLVAAPAKAEGDGDLFRRLVLAEAGGEGELGMALVARSVMNRSALIGSGAATPGTYNARGGSVNDVIRGRGQYEPLSNGSIDRSRSPQQLASAQRAIDLARDTGALRSRLAAQGLSSREIDRLVNATGFRTGSAFNDPSQSYARQSFGNHVFNGDQVSTRQDVAGAFEQRYGKQGASGSGSAGEGAASDEQQGGEAGSGGGSASGVDALRSSLAAAEGLVGSGRSDFARDALSIGKAVVQAIQQLVAKAQEKSATAGTDPQAIATAMKLVKDAIEALTLLPQAQQVLAGAFGLLLGDPQAGLAAALGEVLKAAAGAQGSTPENGKTFTHDGQEYGWSNAGGESVPVALGTAAAGALTGLLGGGSNGNSGLGGSGLGRSGLGGGSPAITVAGGANPSSTTASALPSGTTVRASSRTGSGWVSEPASGATAGNQGGAPVPTASVGSTGARGAALAQAGRSAANRHGTVGYCYRAVAEAVDQAVPGPALTGGSAYMAATQLAQHPGFREVTVAADDLPSLPAGAVVVWGKTSKSPHGHISIADGKGNELSDHVERQRTQLRGYTNVRVFLPR